MSNSHIIDTIYNDTCSNVTTLSDSIITLLITEQNTINQNLEVINSTLAANQKVQRILGMSEDVFYAAFLSLVVSLIVFYLGMIAERYKERESQLLQDQKLKSFFKERVVELCRVVELAIQSYNRHYINHTARSGYEFTPPIIMDSTLNLFNLLDKERLYQVYDNQRELAIMSDGLDAIHGVSEVFSQAASYQSLVYGKSQTFLKKFDTIQSRFLTKLDIVIRQIPPDSEIARHFFRPEDESFDDYLERMTNLRKDLIVFARDTEDSEEIDLLLFESAEYLTMLRRLAELSSNFRTQFQNFEQILTRQLKMLQRVEELPD